MTCQNCKKEFNITDQFSEILNKLDIPMPTFCSECRLVRRMAFRNERTLYKRKCSAPGHGEDIISIFSPDKEDNVFCHKSWWGDSWDATSFALEYDFSKPFFVQMRDLWKSVPDIALLNINPVNSDYCSITEGNKNCYLVIGGDFNENASYSAFVFHCKDVVDCYWLKKCELCYEVSESTSCTNMSYSRLCEGCFDSSFLFNCKNCHHCFGCSNLKNASYQIFNEQYSKEGYENKLKELGVEDFSNREKMKQVYEDFIKKFPRKYARILNSVDCTGDNIEHAKNVKNSFDIFDGAEDSCNLWLTYSNLKDCAELDHSGKQTELSYESSTIYPGSRILFSRFIFTGHDIEYSYNCHNSSYLFGCVGLRNKQYCILNKQYSKEEYEEMVLKIKRHMKEMPYVNNQGIRYSYGEFFPLELSPFSYNESVAQEIRPLSKERCLELGYKYHEPETKNYIATIKGDELQESIKNTSDEIIKEIISCDHSLQNCTHGCSTAFRITKDELDFYRRINIPIPRLCSNCRHYERIAYRNPLTLWKRKCDCDGPVSKNNNYLNNSKHDHSEDPCQNEFETTYSPERSEIVYCEQCYQKEVS
jgi:hypothetical protein